jgi:hypothetical protein
MGSVLHDPLIPEGTTMAPTPLSERQQQLLECLVDHLVHGSEEAVTYHSEWLGVLPFGQYHWLKTSRGEDVRNLPDDWERDDLLALEGQGLIVRSEEWHDPHEPDDVRIVFLLDRRRIVDFMQARLDAQAGPAGDSSMEDSTHAAAATPGVIIGRLDVRMPDAFRLRHRGQSDQAMPGPPGSMASEDRCIWETGDGREFRVLYWVPMAPRPGGPMQSARDWEAIVAGQRTTIIETRVFMGQTRRAMIAHLRFASPAAQVLIIGENMEQPEFAELLAGIRIAG